MKIEMKPDAERWFMSLRGKEAEQMAAAFDQLDRHGTELGRDYVKRIVTSRHREMMELRQQGGNLRALLAIDPRKHAVVLLGGDKTGEWNGWYERKVPTADRAYDKHLRELGGTDPWPPARAGDRSGPRGR